jgi:hypothetical protein
MTPSPTPSTVTSTMLRLCLGIIVGVICLTVAIELLRDIWPWLVGVGILTVVAVGGWRMWSSMQHEKW